MCLITVRRIKVSKNSKKILSKRLSHMLRHKPEEYNVTLDEYGFGDINAVVNGMKILTPSFTKELLIEIVNEDKLDNKKGGRYEIVGDKIRAVYGHSCKRIEETPIMPPEYLYHGTQYNLKSIILKEGLKPMNRKRVCLTNDLEVAQSVGDRRKNAHTIILRIKALELYKDTLNTNKQINFYKETNTIFQVDRVPSAYIEVITE